MTFVPVGGPPGVFKGKDSMVNSEMPDITVLS